MAITKVPSDMIQVANNVTDTTIGGANSGVSVTFDSLGVISAASNVALSINTADISDSAVTDAKISAVANSKITGVMTTAQVADSAITTDKLADANVTVGKIATTVPLGTKNLIINGDMQIAQRGTSSAGEGASEGFKTVDRWNYTVGSDATAGRFTLSQDTADAPKDKGFGYCSKFACTTADTSIAAGEALVWRTKLEGQTLQSIKKGTASAESITFSFWAKGTAATYVWEFLDEDNNRNNTHKFTVTTSWQKFTMTLPADTTGAFNNDNGASLAINLWLHAGANYTSGTFVSNTWATRVVNAICTGIDSFYSSTSNEFYLTGIQLEVGDAATPFEHRPYDMELQRCKRYFYIVDGGQPSPNNTAIGSGYNISTTSGRIAIAYPVEMRATPTFSYTGTIYLLNSGGSGITITSISASYANKVTAMLNFTVASGLTQGYGTIAITNNGSGQTFQASAEI